MNIQRRAVEKAQKSVFFKPFLQLFAEYSLYRNRRKGDDSTHNFAFFPYTSLGATNIQRFNRAKCFHKCTILCTLQHVSASRYGTMVGTWASWRAEQRNVHHLSAAAGKKAAYVEYLRSA